MKRSHAALTFQGPKRAFTLIELMISIALVLLLMLGVNQVFKVTGEAVGTNQALSTGIRDARSVQTVFAYDFQGWAGDSPAIVIRSQRVNAFRNKADELHDRDWTIPLPSGIDPRLTIDVDGNGQEGETTVPGEIVQPTIYNHRSHRIDTLSFFARGRFPRQTGGAVMSAGINANEYVSDMAGAEAWIWYGHIRRPDEHNPVTSNQGFQHRDPGDLPNPAANPPVYNDRNFNSSGFVLGRFAVALVEGDDTDSDGIGDEIKNAGVAQNFIMRRDILNNRGPSPTSTPPGHERTDTLAPLTLGIESNEPAGERWEIQWSRYDLANTSINQFRRILANFRAAWDDNLIVQTWYNRLSSWRFQGDPQPLRPLSAKNAARTAPVLLEHCTHFVVEFAGDFVEQSDGTGTPGNMLPLGELEDDDNPPDGSVYGFDGEIDYIIDNSTGTPVRRIRWYGMPRDVAGAPNGGPDGVIRSGTGVTSANQLIDVVPLRDVLGSAFVYNPPVTAPTNKFIERQWPEQNPATWMPPDFPAPGLPPPPLSYTSNGVREDGQYVVAWGPDTADQPRPKMIRIVITIDDPDGRIAEGQTFEYVYRVGG
jgi:prepilin-type N-terminal cleavage/methylation domain-containing protein